MDLAYMRFSTGDRTFFIAVVSAMSDLTLTNGECEDRHGPKGLSNSFEGEDAVIQHICHDQDARLISPAEAAKIAEAQRIGWIEKRRDRGLSITTDSTPAQVLRNCDQSQTSVRCVPLWDGNMCRIRLLMYHNFGCPACRQHGADLLGQLMEEGLVKARGWAAFKFDSVHHIICVDDGKSVHSIDLTSLQFPQIADIAFLEDVNAPNSVRIWPQQFPEIAEMVPFWTVLSDKNDKVVE